MLAGFHCSAPMLSKGNAVPAPPIDWLMGPTDSRTCPIWATAKRGKKNVNSATVARPGNAARIRAVPCVICRLPKLIIVRIVLMLIVRELHLYRPYFRLSRKAHASPTFHAPELARCNGKEN